MGARIRIALAAALLPAVACAAGLPAGVMAARALGTPSSTPTYLNGSGQIIVPVMIDSEGPFRFLLDTGANGSMIAPRLARKLHLPTGQGVVERVEGITGTQRMPWVLVRRLRFGKIVKTDVRMPLSSSPVLDHLGGILGIADFSSVRIAVDFRDHRVTIGDIKGRLSPGFLEISATRTSGGLLMVPARVGGIEVKAIIDTGSPETLGNPALSAALLARHKLVGTVPIYGVTRQVFIGTQALAPIMILGPVAIQHMPVVYSRIPIFREWHLENTPALIIGMNVLSAADALVLDYSRERVFIRPALPRDGLAEDTANLAGG